MCCELNLAESWELLCCPCRGPGPAPGSAAGTRRVLGTSGSRRSSHGPLAPPIFLTCGTEWLLHLHFWPPQGTPVSAWHLVTEHLALGLPHAICMKKMGRRQGEGSRGVCSVLFIYIFYPPRLPTRGAGSRQVRPNHVGSSRGTERSALRG